MNRTFAVGAGTGHRLADSEPTWQLSGEADARQVDGTQVALQYNIGRRGAAAATVYARPA